MGQTPHEHPVFLLFAIASIICASAFGPATQELIDSICRNMEDYGFCNECFSEHISSPETDMHGLAQIAITQSLSNTTNTLVLANQILRDATDQELVGYLDTCVNGYLSILNMVEDADRALGRKNYSAMLINFLSSAKVLGTRCGQYSNSHGISNPLSEYNREERILITMGAATADSLLNGGGARR